MSEIPHREFCGLCHNVVRVGFFVPNDVWAAVVHHSRTNDIHCLECFTKRADEKMVAWDEHIRFYPVGLSSHLSGNWKPRLTSEPILDKQLTDE